MEESIALVILISEVTDSTYRDRILTFETNPNWVTLNASSNIFTKVQAVMSAGWGGSTNFQAACERILNVAETNKLDPDKIPDLIVFSDMQFDDSCHNVGIFDSAYEKIVKKFYDAGMKTKYRKPYDPPHILFWNLRKTSGFPATTFTKNITFLSGYNSSLLNIFVTKGIKSLRETSPFTLLENIVNIKRYSPMDENISDYLSMV